MMLLRKSLVSIMSNVLSIASTATVALCGACRVAKLTLDLDTIREMDKSVTPEELEIMKTTNLQMADSMNKLTQKLSVLHDNSGEISNSAKLRYIW